jgi:hypothetical protein
MEQSLRNSREYLNDEEDQFEELSARLRILSRNDFRADSGFFRNLRPHLPQTAPKAGIEVVISAEWGSRFKAMVDPLVLWFISMATYSLAARG